MALYRISGVWRDSNNVITHYAFHEVGKNSSSRATKQSKESAIKLLETPGNKGNVWVWNYQIPGWQVREVVEVANGVNGKYLRTNRGNQLTDNLEHLIDYDWISQ